RRPVVAGGVGRRCRRPAGGAAPRPGAPGWGTGAYDAAMALVGELARAGVGRGDLVALAVGPEGGLGLAAAPGGRGTGGAGTAGSRAGSAVGSAVGPGADAAAAAPAELGLHARAPGAGVAGRGAGRRQPR